MLRLIVAVVSTVAVVAFSMTNTHHVELSLVLGESVHIRLISLLAVTFVAGGLTVYFHQAITRLARHAERSARRPWAEAEDEMEVDAE